MKMDLIDKKCFNLWLTHECTWEAYLKSRKVAKIMREREGDEVIS